MSDTIDNSQLLADTGVRVVHFGPAHLMSPKDRPFTVAFKGTGDLVEIATSVVHPQDKFIRKVGTKLAVQKFVEGETIKLPVPRHFQREYASYIRIVFSV